MITDDIVTRLRAMDMWCWHNDHHKISECPDCSERHEAAEEIENLRAELVAVRFRLEEVSRERDRWMTQSL